MTATSKMQQIASSSNKKLQPGKAYKIRRPSTASSAATKMKHMAASCQACAWK